MDDPLDTLWSEQFVTAMDLVWHMERDRVSPRNAGEFHCSSRTKPCGSSATPLPMISGGRIVHEAHEGELTDRHDHHHPTTRTPAALVPGDTNAITLNNRPMRSGSPRRRAPSIIAAASLGGRCLASWLVRRNNPSRARNNPCGRPLNGHPMAARAWRVTCAFAGRWRKWASPTRFASFQSVR